MVLNALLDSAVAASNETVVVLGARAKKNTSVRGIRQ